MPFLSVEVESRRVRVVLLEKEGGTLVILKETVSGIPATEEPVIAITKFLREFVKQNRIATRKVYLTISDPDIVMVKNTLLPAMPAKEIVPAVTWVAREEGSANEEREFFNYGVVKEYEGEDTAKKLVAIYTVVDRKKLNQYLTFLARAGFEVVQVSAEPFDYAKILSCYGDGAAAQAVLDIGYDYSMLAIYQNGKMIFSRNLAFSFTKAKASLNDPLFLGTLHGSAEADGEIEKAMRLYGIPADGSPSAEKDPKGANFFALMRPLIEGLIREVRYSLLYFMTHYKEDKPATLFLTGHGAEVKGLEALFLKELGVSTFNLLLPTKIRSRLEGAAADPVTQSQYIGAVAGVFSGNEVVDFTPLDFKNRRLESLQRRLLMYTTLILAGLLATSFFFMNLQKAFFEDRLNLAKRHLGMLGKVAEVSSAVFPRYYLVSEIERAGIPADKVLRLLGYLLPEEMVIKHFLLEPSQRRLDLDVTVLRPEVEREAVVRDFVGRLQETAFFSSVNLRPQGDAYRIEGEFRDD